ncbi:class I tRNA ligase family protein, partial [Staphylococcus aureus]|uniref:class I tRNA ligase family protein n=1 Tax=Staphylococcus aureus TaxID=1280 RepID=UPI0037D9E045
MHLIPKQILPFHSIISPILFIPLHLPLPKKLFPHPSIFIKHPKITKSKPNLLHPNILIHPYPLHPTRYYLIPQ